MRTAKLLLSVWRSELLPSARCMSLCVETRFGLVVSMGIGHFVDFDAMRLLFTLFSRIGCSVFCLYPIFGPLPVFLMGMHVAFLRCTKQNLRYARLCEGFCFGHKTTLTTEKLRDSNGTRVDSDVMIVVSHLPIPICSGGHNITESRETELTTR